MHKIWLTQEADAKSWSSLKHVHDLTEFMVIFGSEAESRPAWTRLVAVVYGSEGGELGFPSVAQ